MWPFFHGKSETPWDPQRVLGFVQRLYDPMAGVYRSTLGGPVTLYGTCYALLTRHYLGCNVPPHPSTLAFILDCQDPETGFFVGPELRTWSPDAKAKHDREHLLLHLTCATLPVLRQYGVQPKAPLHFAEQYLDPRSLLRWLERRNLGDAWYEGNNILFVGQLLVHLRDTAGMAAAQDALSLWFDWLDRRIDAHTGLWGTDRGASEFEAMCGGYHQFLVYCHERRSLQYPERLCDVILALQHRDGGFSPQGGGGACEDVDAVHMLVELHRVLPSRRAMIETALQRCLRLILASQNRDGGFPYKRKAGFVHMGIPDTTAGVGKSAMFPTWFRVHTLALIADVLPEEPRLRHVPFRFNDAFAMGWHRPRSEDVRSLVRLA